MDMGDVLVMAKATLNGQTYDTLCMPPFEIGCDRCGQARQKPAERLDILNVPNPTAFMRTDQSQNGIAVYFRMI
jgi:hypothetical protein